MNVGDGLLKLTLERATIIVKVNLQPKTDCSSNYSYVCYLCYVCYVCYVC